MHHSIASGHGKRRCPANCLERTSLDVHNFEIRHWMNEIMHLNMSSLSVDDAAILFMMMLDVSDLLDLPVGLSAVL